MAVTTGLVAVEACGIILARLIWFCMLKSKLDLIII